MTTDEALRGIYRRLYEGYGPQHWWPGDTPFEVIVGAILTQSAAWSNVEKAIANLKAADALSPAGLRRLSPQELARLIYSSGYYNAKAKKLRAFVEGLSAFGDDLGQLLALPLPELRQQLLSIYGIGDETADSIILYAARKPVFVIDAYTRRVLERLGLAPARASYALLQRLFMENLPHDAALFNEYHALLVRHGKEACRRVPRCEGCPLADLCVAAQRSPP